jgi:hypothetical protein
MKRAFDFIKNKSNSWWFVVMAAFLLGLFSCCAIALPIEMIINPNPKIPSSISPVPGLAGLLAGLVVLIVAMVILRKTRNLAYEGNKRLENQNPASETKTSSENKKSDRKSQKSRRRLVYNVYLGHLISQQEYIGTTQRTTMGKYSYIPYSPINTIRQNRGKTETDLFCGICGEKLRMTLQSKLWVRMVRLGTAMIISVILLLIMPVLGLIAIIIGLLYIIVWPISPTEGAKLFQIKSTAGHALLSKEERVD